MKNCRHDGTLDCHHIKPISEFGPEEAEIHSLSNLVSLCPTCHAGQHLNNPMLARRAFRISSHAHGLPIYTSKKLTPKIIKREFVPPKSVEVHLSSDGLERHLPKPGNKLASNTPTVRTVPGTNAKSITEGLAWIDKHIADMKVQEAIQRCAEEDIYGHCDYCDKEILLNPTHMTVRRKFLCDDCYKTTKGEE
jgi:hypothetical protein